MKKLGKGMKRILYCVLVGIMILGIYIILTPVYIIPYTPDIIKRLEYSGESVLVITPRLTESAYGINGFYDYYDKSCEPCLTVPIQQGRADRWGSYNLHTVQLLSALGYPMLDDFTLHEALLKDPHYLDQYGTVILLHSEYVTKELFQSITSHKHVIYLSPNALYAEVTAQKTVTPETTTDAWGTVHVQHILTDNITLVRGHGYPSPEIGNGFGWKDDNSPEEYDTDCTLWNFRHISNGEQLDCVQEDYSQKYPNILLKMKDLIT